MLEASAGDIEFKGGNFRIAGTDRAINIMDLAQKLRDKSPNDGPSPLDVDHVSGNVEATFPNGCHIAEVEVDPDTGAIQIVKYTGVNDFGVVVNPLMVAGQVHGGVAQGIGQALMECVSYDADGQPITGSFMDYAMPRARRHSADDAGYASGSRDHQSARHQGLRRGRLRGQPVDRRQRGGRCTVRGRRASSQHAADTGTGVARDPGCQAARGGVTEEAMATLTAPASASVPQPNAEMRASMKVEEELRAPYPVPKNLAEERVLRGKDLRLLECRHAGAIPHTRAQRIR